MDEVTILNTFEALGDVFFLIPLVLATIFTILSVVIAVEKEPMTSFLHYLLPCASSLCHMEHMRQIQ